MMETQEKKYNNKEEVDNIPKGMESIFNLTIVREEKLEKLENDKSEKVVRSEWS